MYEMTEGARVLTNQDGSFTAEVIIDGKTVWSQDGYRARHMAQREADSQLPTWKQREKPLTH
jgi:hypothetical protein